MANGAQGIRGDRFFAHVSSRALPSPAVPTVTRRPLVLACTSLALVAFAANSLLCRAALRGGAIDAASFTAVRLVSGALALAALVALRGRRPEGRGTWAGALALFAYAAPFTFAYLRLPAGLGTLVLFGAVQSTMLGADIASGRRPSRREGLGLLAAVAGLVGLTLPGATAPDPGGFALMALAGIAWGIYSLRGRGGTDPLGTTAGNFARSVPLALVLLGAVAATQATHATGEGLALAAISGALASGVGYALWYTALPALGATRAAIVQSLSPVLAAAGGVLLLGEAVSARLVVCAIAILGGIGIAILRRR